MSTIDEALKQYHHRSGMTTEKVVEKAQKRAELLKQQNATVSIWFLGHCLHFIELTEQHILFRNDQFRLKRTRETAEFEHLCLLFLRAQIVSV